MESMIRLLEFGPPKSGKTKNTCETFPGPVMLYNFDVGGWESITKRKVVPFTTLEEVTQEKDVVYLLDLALRTSAIVNDKTVVMDAQAISRFIQEVNKLFKKCPFGTVVVDPVTMWDTSVNDFIAGKNNVTAMQIQHWGQAGMKKTEIINCINSLPCHTVFLAHEFSDKDELTGQILVRPLCTGQLKDKIGMMFSQYIYSTTQSDSQGQIKYVVWTRPKGLVSGIGMRFPQGVPAVIDNNFQAIFGGTI